MNDTTRLPKWAREQITDLQRQRDVAVRTLNEFQDQQTKSGFWVTENPCTGEASGPTEKRFYLQTHRVCFEWREQVYEVALPHDEYEPYKFPQLRTNNGMLRLTPVASNVIEFTCKRHSDP